MIPQRVLTTLLLYGMREKVRRAACVGSGRGLASATEQWVFAGRPAFRTYVVPSHMQLGCDRRRLCVRNEGMSVAVASCWTTITCQAIWKRRSRPSWPTTTTAATMKASAI